MSAQNLVETSEQSWAETDLTLKGAIEVRRGQGQEGPGLARRVVATVRGPAPAPTPTAVARGIALARERDPRRPKTPEGRVVAVGDADFASNALLGFQGNQDFFLNTVAWLAEDADLISIRPQEAEDQRAVPDRQTAAERRVDWRSCSCPACSWSLGIVSWWRRR